MAMGRGLWVESETDSLHGELRVWKWVCLVELGMGWLGTLLGGAYVGAGCLELLTLDGWIWGNCIDDCREIWRLGWSWLHLWSMLLRPGRRRSSIGFSF